MSVVTAVMGEHAPSSQTRIIGGLGRWLVRIHPGCDQ
jgi:hypothetical protein